MLRRGKYIGTVNVADTTEQEMADMMVGRNVKFNVDKTEAKPQNIVLDMQNVSVKKSKGIISLKMCFYRFVQVKFLGIAGIDGNGQEELVYGLTGLSKVVNGKILINGKRYYA